MLQLMEDVACQWSVWIDLAKAKRRLEEEVQCDDLRGTTLRDEDSEKMRDGFTWDDVLFLGEQQWLSDVFLPGLKEEFKLSSTLVDRSAGGTFEFLKRFHVVEPHYTEITVYPEEKHVHTMFERYSEANGKPPNLCKTPCNTSSITTSLMLRWKNI